MAMDGVRGGTYVYGRLLEVREEACVLDLGSGKELVCRIRPGMREELSERVGAAVGLSGLATWALPSWEPVAFDAEELLPYKEGVSMDETLRRLAELTGDSLPTLEELLRWRHEGDEEDDTQHE